MSILGLRKFNRYKIVYITADLITILMCLLLSVYLHRIEKQQPFFQFYSINESLIYILLGLTVIFIFIFQYNGLYRINIVTTRAEHFANIIKSQYYGILNVVLVSLLIQSYKIADARLIFLTYTLVSLPVLYIIRVEFLRGLFSRLKVNSYKSNAVIVGAGKSGKLSAVKFIMENNFEIEIVGFVDDDREINEEIVNGKRVLGKIQDLRQVINRFNVNEIIVATDNEDHEKLFTILDFCKIHNINIRLTSGLFEIVRKKANSEKYIDIPVVDLTVQYNNKLTLGIKRLIDITVSLFAILLLSPIMISVAVLIKLSSRGPVLLNQVRIGRYGIPFKLYKFRSMKVLIGEDENRVTWIGKIIRKTALDELPQLFNVLKGEMSLVGPRPCFPYEYENYDEWQKRRLTAIPGYTGVWQVGGRSEVTFKDSIIFDLYYVNNMSPWFDLQLIFKTIPAMLFLRGAK